MFHADKTVTVYRKEWDKERGVDSYRGTVVKDVSFFSRIATSVSTDGLNAACEGTLRIPISLPCTPAVSLCPIWVSFGWWP